MLVTINLEDGDKWDSIVRSFPSYDPFYLNKYAEACQINGDGEPLLFYYDDGATRAINVVLVRDIADFKPFNNKIPKNTYFDLSTPYGYGGFHILGEDGDLVFSAYDTYCQKCGYVSEFVRFNLFYNTYNRYSGEHEYNNCNVVCSLKPSLDEITANFDRKVRKNLRRANNSGLTIKIDSDGVMLDSFLALYYPTMERANANKYYFFPVDFFESINLMSDNFTYFYVLFDNEIIATELILYGDDTCYSFLGGSNPNYLMRRPNEFMKYHIIEWAKGRKLKRFVLGGGYNRNDGIFKFKTGFAPDGIVKFFTGKQIFNNNMYCKLVKLRDKIDHKDDSSYFPLYRMPML